MRGGECRGGDGVGCWARRAKEGEERETGRKERDIGSEREREGEWLL